MKLAIMQPYFFPYIGYFQLINAVDKFVIYDNIKFTKKGWIHRNRILVNGSDEYISLQLKNDSDFLDIRERKLSETFEIEKNKLLRRISSSYQKAPFFREAFPLIENCIRCPETNLFRYLHFSLTQICAYLDIKTEFLISSEIDIDHSTRSQDKVIAICEKTGATEYINAIGGKELYDKSVFAAHGIELKFIRSEAITYRQFDNEFVPWLSIADVMMFNSKQEIQHMLKSFSLE